MSITDWITAISSLITVILTIIWIVITIQQLIGIRNALISDGLALLINLESELSNKEEKLRNAQLDVDTISLRKKRNIDPREDSFLTEEATIIKHRLDYAHTAWLNTLDRICFLIRKGHASGSPTEKISKIKDNAIWKNEYKPYLDNAMSHIRDMKYDAKIYTNIRELADEWNIK
jgi:hypothetical protein